MIEISDDKFYGNYRGKVVGNDDPDKKGRVQVRIYPLYSGTQDVDLPWAVPAMPLFCGAASGQGALCIPDIGSWVWCFFERGEYTQPVYFAEAGNGATGVPDVTHYPQRRVLYTKEGLYIAFDDSSKELIVHSPTKVTVSAPTIDVTATGGTVNITGTIVNIN
jgi:hypothetical protein